MCDEGVAPKTRRRAAWEGAVSACGKLSVTRKRRKTKNELRVSLIFQKEHKTK